MKHLGKDNDDIMRAGNPCWESVQKKKKKKLMAYKRRGVHKSTCLIKLFEEVIIYLDR